MADDADVIDQPVAVDPAPPPAADPQPPAADAPQVETKPHGNTGKTPWYMERLAQESQKVRQESERAAAAERRAQEAEALAERLRGGNGADPAPRPPQPQQSDADRRAEVQRAAAEQRFHEDTLEVRNRGLNAFGASFGEALNILSALGATTNQFIGDVLAIDKANAHAMLKKISEDPEKAVALTQMSSAQRIAELTRMTMSNAAPAAADPTSTAAPAAPAPGKTVSKAPAPPPRVDPSSAKVVDWRSDAASDEEFDQGFKEMMQKRRARR